VNELAIMMTNPFSVSRRSFLEAVGRAGTAGVAVAAIGKSTLSATEAPRPLPPLAVFSKLYQELKLDFERSAQVTAEAGYNGIDCAVRPRGEIEPERAADEMPRYAEALGRRGTKMLLLATGISGVDSPHAREILTTAKKLGIRYYRLDFFPYKQNVARDKQISQITAGLNELAAMNRELGVCAVFENHSTIGTKVGSTSERGSGYVGGDLRELHDVVKEFDPDQIAVAFDIGHAIIQHGDQWRKRFEALKDHVRIVYVKDAGRAARFVPFGEGEIGKTDFFRLLGEMNYRAPLCIHIEYPWASEGKKTRAAMIDTMKKSRLVVEEWWRAAAM
jgi:sugar phosphate isomerase/epimerase